MSVLFGLNLAAAVLLLFWPLWFSRRVLGFRRLNPLTIPMLIGIPIELMKLVGGPLLLLESGLDNVPFQYAVLMNNLLTLSQIAGTLFFFKLAGLLHIERYLPYRDFPLSRTHLACASAVFLGIFALAFFLLASAELGVSEWIKNPRLGYQLYRVGQGHWYALAVNSLAVASMLAFAANPAPRAVLFKLVPFLVLAYLMGSKGVILAVFTASLVILSFIGWRHITTFFFACAPMIFLALVWNLYLALSDSFELQSVVAYFDYYRNAADYYRGIFNGDIQLFHGQVTFSSLWAYVPRALVPDKPFVYGILHVNEIFFPGQAEKTNTPAFGGAVEQYADFGVPGVVLFGFFGGQVLLNAVLYYLAFRAPGIRLSRMTLGAFMTLLALSGPLFGIYFPGLLFWLLIVFVALIIRVVMPPARTGRFAHQNTAIA